MLDVMKILELDFHAQRHAFTWLSINSRKALIAADLICDTLPVETESTSAIS